MISKYQKEFKNLENILEDQGNINNSPIHQY